MSDCSPGVPVAMKCPECDCDNAPNSHFCGKCGAALHRDGEAYATQLSPRQWWEAGFPAGTTVCGKYRIIGELGRGGMGVVFKAQDIRLKRTVALKFLPRELTSDQDARERFVREGQAASSLDHSNICTIYEIDEAEDGQLYISMAFYEGETVEEKIRRGPLILEEALSIASGAAQGLAKAHHRGIIHRDIKPANLMVTKDGVVKIMDFGLAMLAGQARLTTDGSPVGTVRYMSPEQINGQQVDHRTDIWSLGVVLYEMVVGQTPFEGDTPQAVMFSIVSKAPRPMASSARGIPPELVWITHKAMARNPKERYQQAEDLLLDVEGIRRKPIRPDQIEHPEVLEADSDKVSAPAPKPIAVVSFENQTGDSSYDYLQRAIPSLLITSLEHSDYLRVTTWERMRDLLKRMDKQDVEIIGKDLGFELCRLDGINTIVVGSFTKAGETFATEAKVLDVDTKKILRSASSRGRGVASILETQIDELSTEISRGLGLSEPKIDGSRVRIAKVTTSSMEAYRCYLEGVDYDLKLYYAEAERSFRKALEFDPGFAMAYYGLAAIERRETGRGWKELVAKAVEYSDQVSPRERFYINAQAARFSGDHGRAVDLLEKLVARYPDEKMAYLILGEIHYYDLRRYHEAIGYLVHAVEIDPLFKMAYNMLAYAYHQTGEFERSIWAIDRYISLAPEEANPYDTRGDLYAYNGEIDRAIESYTKALEKKPDLYDTLSILTPVKLGHMHLFKRDYSEARRCYQRLCSSSQKTVRSFGRTCLALIPLYQGRFQEALGVLEDGLARDRVEQVEGAPVIHKHALKGTIHREKNDLGMALVEIERCMEIHKKLCPDDTLAWRAQYIQLLAENNEIERAAKAAEVFRRDAETKGRTSADLAAYWYAAGWIKLSRGDQQGAVADFQKAAGATRHFRQHYMLAQTFLESGRLEEAVEELEGALSRYDYTRPHDAIWAVKACYLLGLAYEKSGWRKRAVSRYEEFLEIWSGADPGIPEIEDARRRLVRLRKGPDSSRQQTAP